MHLVYFLTVLGFYNNKSFILEGAAFEPIKLSSKYAHGKSALSTNLCDVKLQTGISSVIKDWIETNNSHQ